MISIIVPVYNAEQSLTRTVDSILLQKYTDFELLLVDDGSSDGSGLLCDEYALKDNRIRVFHKENAGVSSARNFGLEKANGEWILFVDSDDEIREDMLDSLLKYSSGMDRVVCGYKRVFTDGSFIDYQIPQLVYYGTLTDDFRLHFDDISVVALSSIWNGIYRKDSIKHLFNEKFLHNEDQLFNLYYMLSDRKISIIPDMLYYYHADTAHSLSKRIWVDEPEHVVLIYKFLKQLLRNRFKEQQKTLFITIVNKIYRWIECIVKSKDIPYSVKRFIIKDAISKDFFYDEDIPVNAFDEPYRKMFDYARMGQMDEIFKLLTMD